MARQSVDEHRRTSLGVGSGVDLHRHRLDAVVATLGAEQEYFLVRREFYDDRPDLHNVYRLSANIVSGGEPHSEEALKKIADMGVKTVLSVDGKVPDQQTAAKYGLRYVHVPIGYDGITKEQALRIVKAVRISEGPIFVHCHHGGRSEKACPILTSASYTA